MIAGLLFAVDRSGHADEAGVAGALRAEALEFAAGMLVVGRRGRSPLQRLLLGGVPERLLHVTPCPLLIVPPPSGGGARAR
jgi:nucleotide-binding universal stress UspA family protein